MTKCVGAERLRVITNWLNNIEDPKWEVQPTVKEGKYIVRQRKTPLVKEEKPRSEDLHIVSSDGETESNTDDKSEEYEQEEDTQPKPKPQPKAKSIPKPKQKVKQLDETQLQILEQLKMFGEEMRRQKEKRERKKEIKKQIKKQLPQQQPQPMIQQLPQPEQKPEPVQQPKQYVIRRRRLHFA